MRMLYCPTTVSPTARGIETNADFFMIIPLLVECSGIGAEL